MQSQKLAIITMTTALLLVISTVSTITPYSVFAKSNAQTSGANSDCPADVFSLFVGVQLQTSANCLNDLNSVQDSDGAAISSTPANAAPNQELDIELEFGDEDGVTLPPPEPQTATLNVIKEVICTQDLIETGRCPAPEQFGITVFGENPNPSSFEGSASGRLVTLEPGEYHVDETEAPILPPPIITLEPAYSADCSGQIEAGQELTCTVTNEFMSPPTEPQPCEDCLVPLLEFPGLASGITTEPDDNDQEAIEAICEALENQENSVLSVSEAIRNVAPTLGLDEATADSLANEIAECLNMLFGEPPER